MHECSELTYCEGAEGRYRKVKENFIGDVQSRLHLNYLFSSTDWRVLDDHTGFNSLFNQILIFFFIYAKLGFSLFLIFENLYSLVKGNLDFVHYKHNDCSYN